MRLEHLVLSNGNIFLPLSNLTPAQRLMLDEQSWPQIAAVLTASGLAAALGASTFTPPWVASYVWNEYLMPKPGGNRLYFIPDANHYLQADRPGAFVQALDHALQPSDGQQPGPLDAERGAPVLVDSSRARLAAAADLLRAGTT